MNTLTRNLTSERHDNCASCLGLILLIQWITPPPNLCLKCFSWRYICKVFALGLSSYRTYIYRERESCVLSSTAFTYSYVFIFESFGLSECDRTLTSLCFLTSNSIYPNHMHSVGTVEYLLCVLLSRRYRDKL